MYNECDNGHVTNSLCPLYFTDELKDMPLRDGRPVANVYSSRDRSDLEMVGTKLACFLARHFGERPPTSPRGKSLSFLIFFRIFVV